MIGSPRATCGERSGPSGCSSGGSETMERRKESRSGSSGCGARCHRIRRARARPPVLWGESQTVNRRREIGIRMALGAPMESASWCARSGDAGRRGLLLVAGARVGRDWRVTGGVAPRSGHLRCVAAMLCVTALAAAWIPRCARHASIRSSLYVRTGPPSDAFAAIHHRPSQSLFRRHRTHVRRHWRDD